MNTYQYIAAGTYLNYWPDEIDYQTLIKRLKDDDFGLDDDAIEPVYYFEGHCGLFLAECISSLTTTLISSFKE